ncbi:NUDIX domain-containing protein [Tomitella fengzijianii]|uniref:NUDIX hydrolase n=1 Tax=Tomitella fengzijianii TaxID=2597660 RepID=A0A516X2J6_9ACTN|nr:NUDIX hydrolase [Tomitella fengzijianii]QDQ97308.1 NUDIX hydrolase [Tomitella fengzijianii]
MADDGAEDRERHEFSVEGSETVYDGAIVALRVDEVAMPGGTTARREVVEHHAAVVIAAVDEDDRITLIRQYRHPLGRRIWELPAGLMDVTGEAALAGAQRELHEEAGLRAARWSVLVDLAASPGFTDETLRVYLAEGLTDAGRPEAQDEEADLEVRAVALSEAVAMVFTGEIVNAAAVAGILAVSAVRAGHGRTRKVDSPPLVTAEAFAARAESRGGR